MTSETDLNVSWLALTNFVRQLTHDIRNQLNGMELETALIADSLNDTEGLESLARIREQLHHTAGSLKALSARFADPCLTTAPLPAAELFLIFQEQAGGMEGLPPIDWNYTLNHEQINVDANSMANVVKELLSNARSFSTGGNLKIEGFSKAGNVIYEFHEPKSVPLETENWGRTPFISTRHNGYGLGLWESRRLVEANNGKITCKYDSGNKELVTSLSFPIV